MKACHTSSSCMSDVSKAVSAPRPSLSTAMSGNSVSVAIVLQGSSSSFFCVSNCCSLCDISVTKRARLSSNDTRHAVSRSMNAFFLSMSTPKFRSSFNLRWFRDLLGQIDFLSFELWAVSQRVTSLFQGLYLCGTLRLRHLLCLLQRWRFSWRVRASTLSVSHRQRASLQGRSCVLSPVLRET